MPSWTWTQTNYATGWGFQITYPLFKDVSLNYWQRLLEKGQCFPSEKLYLQFTGASRPWGRWVPQTCLEAFQQLALHPCRADMRVGPKAPHPITEKRKENWSKVMLIPLVGSGRGGICSHSFGGTHTHLSFLQCYPGAFVCGTESGELDLSKACAEKGH